MLSGDFELGFQACGLYLSAGLSDAEKNGLARAVAMELEELRSSASNQEAVNRIIALLIHGSKPVVRGT